jgi:hypothetical protein
MVARLNFGFLQAISAPRWPGVSGYDGPQYDAEIERHLLHQTLVTVLAQMAQLGSVSGTHQDIIRLMQDGRWRTRQMINEALGITTAALYLPRRRRDTPTFFTGAIVMRKVGRRCWYRLNPAWRR